MNGGRLGLGRGGRRQGCAPVPSVAMARTPRPKPQPRRPSSSGGGAGGGAGPRRGRGGVGGGGPRQRSGAPPARRPASAQGPGRRAGRGTAGRPGAAAGRAAEGAGAVGRHRGRRPAAPADLLALAADLRVPVQHVSRKRLDAEARSEAPQGVLAKAAPLQEADLDDLARGSAKRPPFLVLVDGVTDPGNLGAILRSVDGAGGDRRRPAPPSRRPHHAHRGEGGGRGHRARAHRGRVGPADGHRAAAPGRGLGRRPRRQPPTQSLFELGDTARPSPSRSSSARRAPACLDWCGSAATCWSASRCGVACPR